MHTRAAVCPVHVGREDELRVLADAVAGVAADGRGRMLLVAGEAGVGKSRLAADALRLAADAGLSRLEGQCAPDASVPYACFVNAVRRRTRTMDRAGLDALFDGPAALSAALLPEVAAQVGLPSTDPAAEDLFAAVWQLLARLARPGGGVLLLEDLHWADADSLRLLAYLAGELDDLPVWLVGTYRSDEMHRRHPLAQLLVDLGRERQFDELSLQPLGREQVRTMVSAIFDGTEVGDEFTDAVVERTGGNPFFVEELARALVERGDVYLAGDDWERRELADIQMPLSVRETLLARARTMQPVAVDVLRVAALGGDDLDVSLLADAAGVDQDQVEDALQDGLRMQLLVERRDDPRIGFAFRHALTREAFADELVGPERRRVHRRLAEALVRAHADDLDSVAASVADHFAAAGDDAAFDFALRAARQAAAAFAGDEADHRYDQTLHLLPQGDERRLDLLLEAAGASEVEGISRVRVAFAQEARDLAAVLADPVAQARAICVLEQSSWLAGEGQSSVSMLIDARALVSGRDDYWEAWILRRLVRVLVLRDRSEEAEALMPEALALADRSGNLSALSGLHGTRMMMEPYGPAFQEAQQAAVRAARAGHDLRAELNVTVNSGFVALWSGDLEASERWLRRASELGDRIAPRDSYPQAGYAWLLALRGEYEAAERLARPLRSNRVPTRVVALTALAEAAQRRGAPEAAQIVAELWELGTSTAEPQRSVPAAAARARQVLADDGVDAALPLFWSVLRGTLNWRRQGSHWAFAPDLARALTAAGRVGELAAWAAQVAATTEADSNAHNVASDALCAAYLAAARADEETARARFADALERYRAMPCPARVVEVLIGLADLDWRTGRPDAGSEPAAEALDTAQQIGAAALVALAERAVERSQARATLATILFTDIVGSTKLAARMGDLAWGEVVERHHGIVRRELARAGGREIDTAGDGFLAAFDTPAAAIRCARSISAALRDASITVRAGLHSGECREIGGKLTGLTVHIAARVSQLAGPGEVLVSSTVKDLVVGAPIDFEARGEHELKGVPGRWRLFAVVAG